eukprot:gnl/TRDRNA2_/TRDRNA2_65719_c0_seq1.p1 gnl/TRDRNA2_/TRDRNA2_65719_c0~~gnl/TRDRNA2_/TRDRNA2_65719_c0_seq1.p1  ORF type:complete len:286 (-),score=49.52 gnl/TRDRNA2_/TRDRNA2_65719_c0_seq1:89-946(-)
MVFFEMALSKGAASAGLGLVKVAGSSSAGAAATAALPPPPLDVEPSFPIQLGPHMTALASPPADIAPTLSGVDIWSEISRVSQEVWSVAGRVAENLGSMGNIPPVAESGFHTGIGVAVSSMGLAGLFRVYGWPCCEAEGSDDEDDEQRKGVLRFVPTGLTAVAISDSFMAGVLLHSISAPIAVPLRTWVFGSLLLSYPTTWVINYVVDKHGIRFGFVCEIGALSAAFAWLAWGTVLLSQSSPAAAPLLWWACFAHCILTWSWLTTPTVCMVISTVVSLLLQQQKA